MLLKVTYELHLVLTPQDFRLLSKALRGTLTEEEKPEALALQEKLMRERAGQLARLSREANKTIGNIDAATRMQEDGKATRALVLSPHKKLEKTQDQWSFDRVTAGEDCPCDGHPASECTTCRGACTCHWIQDDP